MALRGRFEQPIVGLESTCVTIRIRSEDKNSGNYQYSNDVSGSLDRQGQQRLRVLVAVSMAQ